MKQTETSNKLKQVLAGIEMKKAYTILMVLSFIYGGFLLATYCFMAYSVLWRGEVFGIPVFEGGPNMPVLMEEKEHIVLDNRTEGESMLLRNETNETHHPPKGLLFQGRTAPLKMLTSPFLMLILAGGVISIANGIAIRSLTHEKEVKQLKENLKKLYLTPEEKNIIDELESSKGEITQKELTERTGYSRVKTHRTLEKLESKKIIQRIPYGQTNKVILRTETKK